MLCNISEEKELLIDALAESDELSIFETELIKDLIDFKWQQFAFRYHAWGFFFHVLYIIANSIYIKAVYVDDPFGFGQVNLLITLGATLLYATLIDGAQIIHHERDHFFDFTNILDIIHVFGGYANIYL